ncbi:MAG: hypothetical protein AB7I30_06125 [Isosphaeraceae bacterium]
MEPSCRSPSNEEGIRILSWDARSAASTVRTRHEGAGSIPFGVLLEFLPPLDIIVVRLLRGDRIGVVRGIRWNSPSIGLGVLEQHRDDGGAQRGVVGEFKPDVTVFWYDDLGAVSEHERLGEMRI